MDRMTTSEPIRATVGMVFAALTSTIQTLLCFAQGHPTYSISSK